MYFNYNIESILQINAPTQCTKYAYNLYNFNKFKYMLWVIFNFV